jgi:LPXTG-motif cell wall-anchored protein
MSVAFGHRKQWGEHPMAQSHCRSYTSDMSTILLIVLVVLLLGGGGGYYYNRRR